MSMLEGDLHLVEEDEESEHAGEERSSAGGDLETLRDEFVDAFNARDLERLLSLVAADVELPDVHGEGPKDLGEELTDIWERSPGVLLTRGYSEEEPVALAWVRNEDHGWVCVALLCFAETDGLLDVIEITDDDQAMESASKERPDDDDVEEGGEFDEWTDGV